MKGNIIMQNCKNMFVICDKLVDFVFEKSVAHEAVADIAKAACKLMSKESNFINANKTDFFATLKAIEDNSCFSKKLIRNINAVAQAVANCKVKSNTYILCDKMVDLVYEMDCKNCTASEITQAAKELAANKAELISNHSEFISTMREIMQKSTFTKHESKLIAEVASEVVGWVCLNFNANINSNETKIAA